MGKLILVTGGARSGKSAFAEELAGGFGDRVLYVATSIAFDDEMRKRIQNHRSGRPSCWETVEAYSDMDNALEGRLEGKSAVLLDCVTIMVTNLMLREEADWDHLDANRMEAVEAGIKTEIEKLLGFIEDAGLPFVLVTNELGMGIVPDSALARLFRDIAGRMNQLIAKKADEVYFCVSGIPLKIKG